MFEKIERELVQYFLNNWWNTIKTGGFISDKISKNFEGNVGHVIQVNSRYELVDEASRVKFEANCLVKSSALPSIVGIISFSEM